MKVSMRTILVPCPFHLFTIHRFLGSFEQNHKHSGHEILTYNLEAFLRNDAYWIRLRKGDDVLGNGEWQKD